ncbi:hypothetical protein SprV_0802627500 [Sparganum proliferum]
MSATPSRAAAKMHDGDKDVVFVIRHDIVGRLACPPQGTNDRHMSLRLPHRAVKFVYIIASVHDQLSSITNSDETKSNLCEDKHAFLDNVPKMDKLAVRIDFNACVGAHGGTCGNVLGTHGFSSCNDSGLYLLQISMKHRLRFANTFFRKHNF